MQLCAFHFVRSLLQHIAMKTIKLILIVGLTFASIDVSVAAQGLATGRRVTPRTLVQNLYNQHRRQSPFFQTRSRALLDRYFTRELANLIWSDARASRGEVGAVGGDPLFNAQDMEIKNFSLRERTVRLDAAEVAASFQNFNERHEILFRLVPAGRSWKVADIVYDDGTTLLGILKGNASPARKHHERQGLSRGSRG